MKVLLNEPPWMHLPQLIFQLVYVHILFQRNDGRFVRVPRQRLPHVVGIFVLVPAVILQDFPVDGVTEIFVHRDCNGIGHPNKKIDKPETQYYDNVLIQFTPAPTHLIDIRGLEVISIKLVAISIDQNLFCFSLPFLNNTYNLMFNCYQQLIIENK